MLQFLPAITGFEPLSLALSTNSVQGAGSVFPIVSNPVSVVATGGSGGYTYAWSRVSGLVDIVATDPIAATTRFQAAANIPSGESRSAEFRVTVTDSEGFSATSGVINVELTNDAAAQFDVSLLPTTLTAQGQNSTVVTSDCQVTVLGGTPPFTYQWQRLSGDGAITAVDPTDFVTAFTATIPVSSVQASFFCEVTDATTRTARTGTVLVSIERTAAPPALVASVIPSSIDELGPGPTIITQQAIATGSGGVPPYTYLWERVTGTLITADDPTSDRTAFRATPPDIMPYLATFTCTITDSVGQEATDTVSVTITREGTPP